MGFLRSPRIRALVAPKFLVLAAIGFGVAVPGCGSGAPTVASPASIASLRSEGKSSSDGEVVGRWALAEMVAPGGTASEAAAAEARLGKIHHDGMYASLAIALAREAHGEPKPAAEAFLATLKATQKSEDIDAPLVGWFAANRLHELRGAVADLFLRHKAEIDALTTRPGSLGWRAVAELVDWSTSEALDKAEVTGDAADTWVVARVGCSRNVRIAGPFGKGTAVDRRRAFPAERPGPWPPSWAPDATRGTPPHVLKVEQHRCLAAATEQTDDGVFYSETFFTVPTERDLIVAVQGSVQVWVDDAPVVARDLREWGVWQRFGARVKVPAGRHRVLARITHDASNIRLLNPDGTPAGVTTDADGMAPYSVVPPQIQSDPNPLTEIVKARTASSPLQAFLASNVAHIEAMDDVAGALIEQHVEPEGAAALALDAAASFAHGDAAYPEDVRRRNERRLRMRAVAKDPKLWFARAWLTLDDGEQKGLVEGVAPLRKLADEFPNEPELLEGLARLYGRLSWRGERMSTLVDLSKRFPDDVGALRLYSSALEEDGPLAEADAVGTRIKKLDPDAEVDLERAIARHDWKAAVAELQRIQKRRPDRKEIAGRIADVLERGGDPDAAAQQLVKALAKNPEDATARFKLADKVYAKGDVTALRRALAEALQAGASGEDLREAIALVEGATHLEPYRLDGRAVIKEFERWEKTGKKMEGTAARVLDYSALWVHPDGSSEMLEHEIQRIQSQEAIGKEAEQPPPPGLVLRLRVIKPDGSILEPEPVAGKPTLTMPHLEVGDYLEIEHISPAQGDGEKGKRYRGPQWFFREADKGYWRSEFVALTPKDRPLDIETRGAVPKPLVRDVGTFTERRWRVDESPPAPEEPDSPRPQEFLPSVRIGWGISLEETLARLVDVAADETPLDPRLGRIAETIVKGVPKADTEERARRVYQYVLDQIEEGQENDGRRVVTGRSGARQAAFMHLVRQLGIPVELAVVKGRLAIPAMGKMSEVEMFDSLVLRVATNKGVRWMTVRDKFSPFGYLASDLRGQPAIRLVPGTPRETTTGTGALDGVGFEGRATLRPDGSATVDLAQSYTGKVGTSMRNVFDKVPEMQLHDFVESRLVGRNFPGAHVREFKIENKGNLEKPLVVRLHLEVPQLARPVGAGLSLKSIFPMRIAQLAQLPSRQTPLLIGTSSHVDVKFEIVVPDSMRMPTSLPIGEAKDGERIVKVADAVHGHALYLDRMVDIPAGRVQPGPEYATFQKFTQDADQLVERDILLGK
jgi:tetratricopeptide (TPR) repeat protein